MDAKKTTNDKSSAISLTFQGFNIRETESGLGFFDPGEFNWDELKTLNEYQAKEIIRRVITEFGFKKFLILVTMFDEDYFSRFQESSAAKIMDEIYRRVQERDGAKSELLSEQVRAPSVLELFYIGQDSGIDRFVEDYYSHGRGLRHLAENIVKRYSLKLVGGSDDSDSITDDIDQIQEIILEASRVLKETPETPETPELNEPTQEDLRSFYIENEIAPEVLDKFVRESGHSLYINSGSIEIDLDDENGKLSEKEPSMKTLYRMRSTIESGFDDYTTLSDRLEINSGIASEIRDRRFIQYQERAVILASHGIAMHSLYLYSLLASHRDLPMFESGIIYSELDAAKQRHRDQLKIDGIEEIEEIEENDSEITEQDIGYIDQTKFNNLLNPDWFFFYGNHSNDIYVIDDEIDEHSSEYEPEYEPEYNPKSYYLHSRLDHASEVASKFTRIIHVLMSRLTEAVDRTPYNIRIEYGDRDIGFIYGYRWSDYGDTMIRIADTEKSEYGPTGVSPFQKMMLFVERVSFNKIQGIVGENIHGQPILFQPQELMRLLGISSMYTFADIYGYTWVARFMRWWVVNRDCEQSDPRVKKFIKRYKEHLKVLSNPKKMKSELYRLPYSHDYRRVVIKDIIFGEMCDISIETVEGEMLYADELSQASKNKLFYRLFDNRYIGDETQDVGLDISIFDLFEILKGSQWGR